MSPDWWAGRALPEHGSLYIVLLVKDTGRRFSGDLRPKGLDKPVGVQYTDVDISRQ